MGILLGFIVIIGILGLGLLLTSCRSLVPATPPDRAAKHFRLMTLNLAHGRGLAFDQRLMWDMRFRSNLGVIGKFFDASGADIIALQEVDFDSNWNGNFDHLAYLGEHCEYPHSAKGVNNKNGGYYRLNYGNAFLAKHVVQQSENHAFGQASIGEKGFLYAEFVVHGVTVPVVNLHLDFRTRERRLAQIGQLNEFLLRLTTERRPLPIIVGDFNSQASKAGGAARMLLDFLLGFEDYRVFPGPDDKTFPSGRPRRAIDLIFVPPRYAVHAVKVLPARLSDHLPVYIDFELPGHAD